MKALDVLVFNFINHGLSNQACDLIMPIISRLGGGILYFIVGIFFILQKKREDKLFGVFLTAGLTISYYIVGFLKVLVARPRPFIALHDTILLGTAEKSFSFPSNHAATAFMVAFLLAGRFKMHAVFYLLASVVAFSRIYMGVHYPTDVIFGAFLGCLIGWFLAHTCRKVEQN